MRFDRNQYLAFRSCLADVNQVFISTPIPQQMTSPLAQIAIVGLASGGKKHRRITTDSVITEFVNGLDNPRGIINGPDGNLWFTLAFVPQIAG